MSYSEEDKLVSSYFKHNKKPTFPQFSKRNKDEIVNLSAKVPTSNAFTLMQHWIKVYNRVASSKRLTVNTAKVPKAASLVFKEIFKVYSALGHTDHQYTVKSIVTLGDYASSVKSNLSDFIQQSDNNVSDGEEGGEGQEQQEEYENTKEDKEYEDEEEYENTKEDKEYEDEEEDKIPSDFTIDHHPHRTCAYALTFVDSDQEQQPSSEVDEDDMKWVIGDTCISSLCFELKTSTTQIIRHLDPAQVSDIRILILNDIFIFDKNPAHSVSQYFNNDVHKIIKLTLLFDTADLTRGLNCYNWCQDIETCPPDDWSSALSLCAQLLTIACKSGNILDMHTAQVLTQILPIFINEPPGDEIEDSYVHNYLSPLLSFVFASDPRLKLKWANGQLKQDTNDKYKPDFSVYNLSGSTKCILLIAEFKPKEQNSYIESDLVKFAKQMKSTFNSLITDGVKDPKVCGILCEGENVTTYTMDLPCPKLYRMANVSRIKLFKNLDQLSLLPNLISHLLNLKTIASQAATKAETASLIKYKTLKRSTPSPPLEWLSSGSVTVYRVAKKQKK